MTVERFEEIQEEIQERKEAKIRAESTMENIEADWKTEMGLNGLKEAEAEADKLREELKGLEAKRDGIADQLEELMEAG